MMATSGPTVTYTYKDGKPLSTSDSDHTYSSRLWNYTVATKKLALSGTPAYEDYLTAADNNATAAATNLQLAIWTQLGLTDYYVSWNDPHHNYYNDVFGAGGLMSVLQAATVLDPTTEANISNVLTALQTAVNGAIAKQNILTQVSNLDIFSFNPSFDWSQLGPNVSDCITTLDVANSMDTYVDQYGTADIKVTVDGVAYTESAQTIQTQIAAGHTVLYADPNYSYLGQNVKSASGGVYNTRVTCYQEAITYLQAHNYCVAPGVTYTYQDYADAADNFLTSAKSFLQLAIFTALGLASTGTSDYYQIYGTNGVVGLLNSGNISGAAALAATEIPIVKKDIQTAVTAWIANAQKSDKTNNTIFATNFTRNVTGENGSSVVFGSLNLSGNTTLALATSAFTKAQTDYSNYVNGVTSFGGVQNDGEYTTVPYVSNNTNTGVLSAYFCGGGTEQNNYTGGWPISGVTIYQTDPKTGQLVPVNWVTVIDGTSKKSNGDGALNTQYSAADIDFLIAKGYSVAFTVQMTYFGNDPIIKSKMTNPIYQASDAYGMSKTFTPHDGFTLQEIQTLSAMGYRISYGYTVNDGYNDYIERHTNYFDAIEHKAYLQTCVSDAGTLATQYSLLNDLKSANDQLAQAGKYYSEYTSSMGTTTNFVVALYSMMSGAESEMKTLDLTVVEIDSAMEILNAEALVEQAQLAYDNYMADHAGALTNYTDAGIGVSGVYDYATGALVSNHTVLTAQQINAYYAAKDVVKFADPGQEVKYWNINTGLQLAEPYLIALQTALANEYTLLIQYQHEFGFPSSNSATLLNELKGKLMLCENTIVSNQQLLLSSYCRNADDYQLSNECPQLTYAYDPTCNTGMFTGNGAIIIKSNTWNGQPYNETLYPYAVFKLSNGDYGVGLYNDIVNNNGWIGTLVSPTGQFINNVVILPDGDNHSANVPYIVSFCRISNGWNSKTGTAIMSGTPTLYGEFFGDYYYYEVNYPIHPWADGTEGNANLVKGIKQAIADAQTVIAENPGVTAADYLATDQIDYISSQYGASYLIKTPYVAKDGNTYYTYSVNKNNPAFNPANPFSIMNKAKHLEGTLIAYAILYEAWRDLRGLVEQELDGGESDGYKGMNIYKLFAKRVEKMMGYIVGNEFIQGLLSDMMQAVQSLNDAEKAKEESAINKKYQVDEAAIEGESWWSRFWVDTREKRSL